MVGVGGGRGEVVVSEIYGKGILIFQPDMKNIFLRNDRDNNNNTKIDEGNNGGDNNNENVNTTPTNTTNNNERSFIDYFGGGNWIILFPVSWNSSERLSIFSLPLPLSPFIFS